MDDVATSDGLGFETFFVESPRSFLYASSEEELAAVASGAKAMSMAWSHESIDNLPAEVRELPNFAARNGLAFEHRAAPNNLGTYLFVVRPSEIWRVSMFMDMRRVLRNGYEWNDGIEFLESRLLGYSEEQARQWVDERKRTGLGLQGYLLYLVLSETQAAEVSARRGYWLPSGGGYLVCPQPAFALKDDLHLGDRVLGRFVVGRKFVADLVEKPLRASSSGVVTLPWTSDTRDQIWSGLKRRVELLVDGIWV